MAKNTKTIFKGFDYMHCDDFARLLMDMATKGWHFKEWGVGLKFEKGEPEQAVYAVEVFTKASENDTRPEPDTKEFAEYCEAAGWKFIDGKQKFCIFKKIEEDAAELFTPEERVVNSFKASTSGTLISLLIVYGINALLQWININTFFERHIFSGTFLFSFSVWNVMFLGQLMTFVYAFYKRIKLQKEIKEGKDIYIGRGKGNKIHFTLRDVYIGLLMLLLLYYFIVMEQMELFIMNIVLVGTTLLMVILLNKFRPERKTNMIIQYVFSFGMLFVLIISCVVIISDSDTRVFKYQDDVPLYISDYRDYEGKIDDIDLYHEANLFGSVDNCFLFYEEDSIHYTIYKSSNSRILDKIWKEEFDGKKANELVVECTLDWNALKAIRNEIGDYYVRYEDSLLILSEDKDIYLTPDQINIICDKLGLR